MKFGELVRELRHAKGWSQRDLAEKVDVGFRPIQKLCHAEFCRVSEVEASSQTIACQTVLVQRELEFRSIGVSDC